MRPMRTCTPDKPASFNSLLLVLGSDTTTVVFSIEVVRCVWKVLSA